jgi:hypothetical protein
MQNGRERVVVHEHLDERELPVREAAPSVERAELRGCGAARGEYEATVEYVPPAREA